MNIPFWDGRAAFVAGMLSSNIDLMDIFKAGLPSVGHCPCRSGSLTPTSKFMPNHDLSRLLRQTQCECGNRA